MFFRQLYTKESTISYILGCGGQGKGIAIDVVEGDEQWFLEQAEEQKSTITYVLDTHIHADHLSGGRKLAQLTGAKYCLHEYNKSRVKFNFTSLVDGDKIEAGNVIIDVIHTPGHTPDSLCFLVSDLKRGNQPWFILTGDTIFVGSVGRPDLTGQIEMMADDLYESVYKKLLSYPDDLEIYPGHQAGSLCGAGISAKPSSTIGFEKKFNAGLKFLDKKDFINYVIKDLPPRPVDMKRIIEYNTGQMDF